MNDTMELIFSPVDTVLHKTEIEPIEGLAGAETDVYGKESKENMRSWEEGSYDVYGTESKEMEGSYDVIDDAMIIDTNRKFS